MAKDIDETEETLQAFHEAHQRRVSLMQDGGEISDEVIGQERDAICCHAAAIRAYAERLAKLGR
jgi:hypothetical protein